MRSFPQRPYYDTFNELNKYMQVLYRPGWAVQTRELNEMQSILQNQIGSFADSIYANGSRVIGGEVSINTKQSYVKLASSISGVAADYVGCEIKNVTGTLKATIVNYIKAEGSDPDTLYIDYLQSDSDDSSQAFTPGQQLVITLQDSSERNVTVAAGTDSIGIGLSVTINRGIYYSSKRFIPVEKQNVILSKYTDGADQTIQVGLVVTENIVTPEMDETLLDNASGSPNENAPGAHRYKVEAILTDRAKLIDRSNTPIDTGSTNININNYVQVVTVKDNEIVTKTRVNELSTIGDILARRTFDESGDYIIDSFLIEVREHLDNGTNRGIIPAEAGGDINKFVAVLDPGKAYVKGYELQTTTSTQIVGEKARTTAAKSELKISTAYGLKFGITNLVNLPGINSQIILREGVVPIGTAFVRSITYKNTEAGAPQYDLEIFAPRFNVAGKGLKNVNNVVDDDTSFTAVTSGFENSGRASSIIPIGHGFVQNISDLDISFVKEYTGIVNGTVLRIAAGVNDQFSGNANDFIVTINGVTKRPDSVTRLIGNGQVDLGVASFGSVDGITARVFAVAERSGLAPKTKNLVKKTGEVKPAGALVQLDNVDAISIDSIKIGSVDYTRFYELDGGQTDTSYNFASLNLRPGFTAPVGNLTIDYTYFQHSLGDYFAPQSYENIPYENIPYFTTADGSSLFLGACLDFRPKQLNSASYDTQSALSFSSAIDAEATFTYYLGRKDIVTLNKSGEFSIVKGIPSLNPESPDDMDDAITLYELDIPPFTFSISDIKARKFNYRRFTMKDIGNMEKRLENMEYVVALSLLEMDANKKEFVDKFKSGFIVDNFKSQRVIDFSNKESEFGFDIVRGEGRPIELVDKVNFEPTQLTNVVVRENKAYLPYTEVVEVEQLLASKIERLQPFTLFNWNGVASLNPSRDNWVSVNRLPDQIIVNNVTTSSVTQSTVVNNIETDVSLRARPRAFNGAIFNQWGGTAADEFDDGRRNTRSFETTTSTARTSVGVGVTQSSSSAFAGTNSSTSAIPWIRERDVTFTALSMKPFTRVSAFFDGVNVNRFCRPSNGDFGDQLITDGIGSLSGVFRIPNTETVRFRTGERVFSIVDDSASTSAGATYTANGVLQTIQNVVVQTVVTNINVNLVTTVTNLTQNVTVRRVDPLAQSFSVGQPGGAFITSVDIWFGPDASTNIFDVRLEIRGMTNGYPNSDVIARKILRPNQILGSADATVATRFTFDSPAYLEDDVEYCFVVMTNSETLTVFTAGLGEPAILPGGAQGEVIAKQPFIGSMFKSQNNITWEAAQTQDMKFRLNRAKFNNAVVGEVLFANNTPDSDINLEADPYRSVLGFDPFTFTQGSNIIRVFQYNHGFATGDLVKLTGPSTTPMNGIPLNQIFAPAGKTVTVVSDDVYTIQATANATISGRNGGNGIIANQQLRYSIINAAFTDTSFINTSTEYFVKTMRADTGAMDTNWISIEPRRMHFFDNPKVTKQSGDSSVLGRALLKSTKQNLSPVVDLETAGAICSRNRINQFDDISGDASCVYVSRSVSLINPANEIKVFVDINLPPESTVKMFYKVGQKTPNEQSDWVEIPATSPRYVSDDLTAFIEHSYGVIPGNEFFAGQVKIVLSTTNEAKPPKIKNLRIIYVNDGNTTGEV